MKGGNGATNRSGITQFAEGEPKSGAYRLVRRSGECVISFANAHSITAFHLFPIFPILFFLQNRNYPQDLSFRRR